MMGSESKEIEYPLPYDHDEDRRLKMQHDAIKFFAGGNLLKPVRDSLPSGALKFLDVAGGSGIWAAEVAREYPNSQVIIMDIRNQSQNVDFPSNCSFIHGDMTKIPFPFGSNEFDCVQLRICPTIRERDLFFGEVNRILKPGGYIQLVDIYNLVPDMGDTAPPPAILLKMDLAMANLVTNDIEEGKWVLDPYVPGQFENGVHSETGTKLWEDVQHGYLPIPISAWPSDKKQLEIGRMMAGEKVMLLEGFRNQLVRRGIMNQEEFENTRKELHQTLHAEPPPKVSIRYSTHLARKVLTK